MPALLGTLTGCAALWIVPLLGVFMWNRRLQSKTTIFITRNMNVITV